MSTGQFFATRFCEFRCATFFHKSTPQKTAGYMGVMSHQCMIKLSASIVAVLVAVLWFVSFFSTGYSDSIYWINEGIEFDDEALSKLESGEKPPKLLLSQAVDLSATENGSSYQYFMERKRSADTTTGLKMELYEITDQYRGILNLNTAGEVTHVRVVRNDDIAVLFSGWCFNHSLKSCKRMLVPW